MRRAHRVPLPAQAAAILRALKQLTGRGVLVFPSIRSVLRSMSENTLNAALRRMGYGTDEMTAHGFRDTALTLLNECGQWAPDVIERQLAHVEGNEFRRAYARGDHWNDRIAMMAWWANHLDTLRADGNIVPDLPPENWTGLSWKILF
jgi:integrase